MTGTRAFSLLLAFGVLASALAGCLTGDEGDGKGASSDDDKNAGAAPPARDPLKTRIAMKTSMGTVYVDLEDQRAPVTTRNFVNLSKDGFYDGTLFHRVIGPASSPPDGFMIQGGDPLSKDGNPANDGTGDPGYEIPDEFHPELRHEAGVLSMANSGPNTGGSQFFITLTATSWLDDKHAVFGKVVGGMDVVRKIGAVATDSGDRPTTPVKIESMTVEAATPESATVERGADPHLVIASKTTEAGRPVTFAVVGKNTGNVADRLTASAEVPEGWTASVDLPTQEVPAGTARVFIVTITPPAGASGATDVPITLASASDAATSGSATAKVTVGDLGDAAGAGSTVTGNYAGFLEDGRLFDTSMEAVAKDPEMGRLASFRDKPSYNTFSFEVGGGVIEGFSELATGALEGEVRTGRIPPEKAYGPSGQHALAGRTLIFELEIVEVK